MGRDGGMAGVNIHGVTWSYGGFEKKEEKKREGKKREKGKEKKDCIACVTRHTS